jgi:dihydropyrimidine dehydrogenase (NAD+) subunit PreT
MAGRLEQHPIIAERFGDLHPPFPPQAAVVEANRCLNCFDAPCTAACPTHIDVPKFIKKIANDNLRGSALSILDANILGASCSRVCPVDVLCEGACVMHRYNKEPIEIARLQRFAMDAFHARGGTLPRKSTEERAEKIACIGAGPASLACAAELKQQGFQVTVFDRQPLPGGLNTYGVAEYKLPAFASLGEIELIEKLGVTFRFDMEIGDEAVLADLENEYDVIFLGVGLGATHTLNIPGGGHSGVIDALQFIADYKTGRTTQVSGRVAVIGAGNTAIDAASAAKRLGAEEVSIVYRRTAAQMSAFGFEYEHAKQEDIRFLWETLPVQLIANDGAIEALECVRVEPGENGMPEAVKGSEFRLACNLVIPAIGQSPLLGFLSQCRGVRLERGRVAIDRATGRTANSKYYAGGDCVNGGREVVDAVADGKRAGVAIAQTLGVAHA